MNGEIDILSQKLPSKIRHTPTCGALTSCFDLIRSHQQCISRSNQQPQYADTETLHQGPRFMPHIGEAESTSHGIFRDHIT